jgi:protein-S-isoprenylcysteine O-methyltransferase Ste14
MPLSEQEQRLLEEMERNLYQNDADFVATVGVRRPRTNYRSAVLGAVVVVLGVIVLIVGVSVRQPIVGVFGFLVMFSGVLVAIAPPRKLRQNAKSPAPTTPGKDNHSAGFMDSLNDRWERRQDNRDA